MDRYLRPVVRVLTEIPDHPNRLAGRGDRGGLLNVVPDDRGDDAGSIGEREAHVVRPCPRTTDLALADEQHLVDGASVLQVTDVSGHGGRADELHVRGVVLSAGFLTRRADSSAPG